ncbi:Interferon alpha/beta receptor 2 [Camelus dromedarius]|uniref:Interferon alpha/beta receptor 2 n=1 Tax=Camelus dromedarius TaxID=9838 RepID=A0A5N4EKA2_CAMDR|nr:Interferon alpha/beta receptor 2 [Camelus dromedarius]
MSKAKWNTAHFSLVFGISYILHDFSNEYCTLKMTLQNFRSVLSWEVRNHSVVPTHYTLWYTIISKSGCLKVLCFLRTGVQRSDDRIDAMSLDPPEFEIVDFTDHINVKVKFQSVAPKILDGEELQFYLAHVIEEQSGGIVKKYKPEVNGNITENFNYVINKLIPNINYCVSVYFEPKDPEKINRSPLKCTLLQPGQESESSESATIGGIITLFLIVAVFISTIMILKRIGYICLRNDFPKVLDFYKLSAWVFPELPPLEKVATVEIIHVNRKKKVWDYSYDESDSDDETAPQVSAGGYTMHGLRPLGPTSTSSATLEDCSDQATEEPDLPEPEAVTEAAMAPGPSPWQSECTSGAHEVSGDLLQDALSEEGSSPTEDSGDRIIFNVDLNSVLVRVLDDEDDDNSEVTPMLSSLPEEAVMPEGPAETDSSLLVARGEGTQLPFPSPSAECLWPEDAPSDHSDTSESDVDIGDGYIMR